MRLIQWLGAVASWFAEPRRLWLAPVVLVLLVAAPLVGGIAEAKVRWSGLALQVCGIATVAYGLRQTRRLFGRPPVRMLLREWLRRFPSWRTHVVRGRAAATASSSRGARTRGTVWTTMDSSLSQLGLLQAIRKNVEGLNSRLLQLESQADASRRALTSEIDDERKTRSAADKEIRAKLEAAETGGLYISLVGLVSLLAGLLLTTLSGEIARWLG